MRSILFYLQVEKLGVCAFYCVKRGCYYSKASFEVILGSLDRRQVFCTDQTSYLPDAKEHPGEKKLSFIYSWLGDENTADKKVVVTVG